MLHNHYFAIKFQAKQKHVFALTWSQFFRDSPWKQLCAPASEMIPCQDESNSKCSSSKNLPRTVPHLAVPVPVPGLPGVQCLLVAPMPSPWSEPPAAPHPEQPNYWCHLPCDALDSATAPIDQAERPRLTRVPSPPRGPANTYFGAQFAISMYFTDWSESELLLETWTRNEF